MLYKSCEIRSNYSRRWKNWVWNMRNRGVNSKGVRDLWFLGILGIVGILKDFFEIFKGFFGIFEDFFVKCVRNFFRVIYPSLEMIHRQKISHSPKFSYSLSANSRKFNTSSKYFWSSKKSELRKRISFELKYILNLFSASLTKIDETEKWCNLVIKFDYKDNYGNDDENA